jgi:hypothetical protein
MKDSSFRNSFNNTAFLLQSMYYIFHPFQFPGNDGSIFIVPALSLVDPNAVLHRRWSTTDLTSFPSPLLHTNPSSNSYNTNIRHSHPTAIVWWQSVLECHHVAIMGTDCGDLIFVSLTTGLQVGITFVQATVSVLHICQDNRLDSVFLLVSWCLMHVDLCFIFCDSDLQPVCDFMVSGMPQIFIKNCI